MTMTLRNVKQGTTAVVREIHGGHGMRRRLHGVGLHPGNTITIIRSGVFGGPVLVDVHGAHIAIGHRQAQRIEVEIPETA
jgi:ferrous iron transport protein A